MKVKDVLKLAFEFAGEKELAEKLAQSGDGALNVESGDFNDAEKRKLNEALSCFNSVNQEIASDYLPFLTRESVDATSGGFLFSSLSKRVISIFQVKDKFGFDLGFRVLSNFVETSKRAKSVVYSFLPEKLGFDDEMEFFNGLSERVYAYGVASEFLLVSGLGGDADIWEERFKESLFMLSRKHGEHRLPKRRWL